MDKEMPFQYNFDFREKYKKSINAFLDSEKIR